MLVDFVVFLSMASMPLCCDAESILAANIVKSDRDGVRENLKSLLDFVDECPEFESSDVVLATTTRRFYISIDDYLFEKKTAIYRVELEENSHKLFASKSKLTWIILTETVDFGRYGDVDLWTTMNKYIVIFVGDCGQEVNGIFDFLWERYRVSGVIVASFCDKFKSFLKYSPFEKSSRDSYGVVERVELKNDFRVTEITESRVFENFENLNGYSLEVCVFSSTMLNVTRYENGEIILSGAEAEMIWSIRRGLNATFRLDNVKCTSNDGDPFEAALKNLKDGVSDLILTGYFEKLYDGLGWNYEFTSTGYGDKLCIIIPASGPLPKYFLPLAPFSKTLWPVLLLYNIAMRVLMIFTRRTSLAIIKPRDLSSRKIEPKTPIDRLDSYVRLSFPSYVPNALSERLLLTSTLLTSIVLLGCYQSGLTSYLSMSSVQKPTMNTLAEVAESDFLIYSKFDNLLDGIFNGGTSTMRKLKSKIRTMNSSESPTEIAAYHKNITTIGRMSDLHVDNYTKYFDENGDFLLHIVDECPAHYMVAYVVPHGSPLLKRLNMVILRLEEAGLHRKWILDERFTVQLDNAKHAPETKRGTVLSLGNFTLEFVALFIGLSASCLMFIFEKYYHSVEKSQRLTHLHNK